MANAKLRFDLLANTTGFTGGLNKASARLKKFGNKVTGIGRSMRTSFTLPMALAGGAAIKMAMDFDRSMTQIATLVGRTDEEIKSMSSGVKVMAKEFAISSKEAADALYFITSAGLDTKNAMATLEVSMKAAALGLGETKTIASLSTAAMAAYGKENLSTAAATDVLMSAVKEGRLDASQLADSMELVIDSANVMGVEFHELGAAFAAVSRTNKNASIAATGLRQVLMQVLKPSEQAKEQLDQMGLSAQVVRQSIAEDGLLNTLTMLTDRFEGNDEAITKVFGSVRALQPVLSLTGSNAEEVRGIFERMSNTAGAVDKGFTRLQQSADFRLRKSLNAVKEDMASLGADLLGVLGPAISKLASLVSNLFNKFQQLTPQQQKLAVVVATLAAAFPLVITAVGKLITLFGALLSPAGLIAAAIASIAFIIYKNWGEILPVVVGLYNRFVDLYNSSKFVRVAIAGIGSVFKSVFIAAKAQIAQVTNAFGTMWKLIKEFSEKGFKGSFGDILKDGLAESQKISAQKAKDIATTFSDDYTKALGNKLEHKTAEQVQGSIDNAVNAVKGKGQEIMNNLFGSASGIGSGGGAGGDDGGGDDGGGSAGGGDGSPLGNVNEQLTMTQQLMNELGMTSQTMRDQVAGSFQSLSSGIVDSMGIAGTAIGAYVQQMLDMVTQTLTANMTIFMSEEEKAAHKLAKDQQMIASQQVVDATKQAGVATTIASNVSMNASDTAAAATSLSTNMAGATGDAVKSGTQSAKGFGPAAAFVLPALIAGAVTVVTKQMKKAKKFKEGGIVSGTTLGMVGEYAGARSNPEVIAPLDKLKGMLPQPQAAPMSLGGEFRLDGQDLVLALGRANENEERL
jgi:TP901 family phage tail tape measure protein